MSTDKTSSLKVSHHITSLIKACSSLGLSYENMDDYSHQLLKITNKGKDFIFGAGNICSYPINSATSMQIVKDKSHAITILRKNNIKTPYGEYFFIQDSFSMFRGSGREIADAIDFANNTGYPLFVKPNDGSRGAFVEKVYSETDLLSYIKSHKDKFNCIRIEKPLSGNEYRLFVLDGEIKFSYIRKPSYISFDGIQSVETHLVQLMKEQEKKGFKSLSLDSSFIRESLLENNLSLDSIPTAGISLQFSPAMNLALGGQVENYTESLPEHLHSWVKNISQIFNLRLMGLDVYSDDIYSNNVDLTVLEINANPSLESADRYSKKNIVEKIWAYVIDETFKNL